MRRLLEGSTIISEAFIRGDYYLKKGVYLRRLLLEVRRLLEGSTIRSEALIRGAYY